MNARWLFKLGYDTFAVDQADEAQVMKALAKLVKMKEEFVANSGAKIFVPDTNKMEIGCVLVAANMIQLDTFVEKSVSQPPIMIEEKEEEF